MPLSSPPHSPWPSPSPAWASSGCAERGVDVPLTSSSPAFSTTIHFSSPSSSALSVDLSAASLGLASWFPPCSLQFLSTSSRFKKSWRANSSSQSKSSPGLNQKEKDKENKTMLAWIEGDGTDDTNEKHSCCFSARQIRETFQFIWTQTSRQSFIVWNHFSFATSTSSCCAVKQ